MCLLMGSSCHQEHLEGLLVDCPHHAAPLPQLRAE